MKAIKSGIVCSSVNDTSTLQPCNKLLLLHKHDLSSTKKELEIEMNDQALPEWQHVQHGHVCLQRLQFLASRLEHEPRLHSEFAVSDAWHNFRCGWTDTV